MQNNLLITTLHLRTVKRAVISLKKTENLSRVIAGSLLPELDRTVPRTDVALKEDDNTIYLEINADDVNALRAAMNSFAGCTTPWMI